MTIIYDAAKPLPFSERKILFDTNIWIAIDGNDPRPHHVNYSELFGLLLKSTNTLVTNDYVISEYYNRACKIQYDIAYRHEDDRAKHYKRRRKAGDLQTFMSNTRDICLDIITDCEFENAICADTAITELINEVAKGQLDFGDLALREHSARNGYVLVSDDGDFFDCGLELITANPRLLKEAERQGKLADQ